MSRSNAARFWIVSVVLLAFAVLGGPKNAFAQQTGGLPQLERRVAALESLVSTLAQTNADQAAKILALTARLDAAEAKLASQNTRVQNLEAKTAPIAVVGTQMTITGVNVFIQDGSGSTASNSGLGNLTIGYNGLRGFGSDDTRTGSHNLVLGDLNNYSSYGGLVVGYFNTIANEYASVSGGFNNTASGRRAAVSGGSFNSALNTGSAVSGGSGSSAEGISASVSGGFLNRAIGDSSTVGGGQLRVAPGDLNWVAGLLFQAQ